MHKTVKQTYIQQDRVHLGTHVEAFHQSCTVGRKKKSVTRAMYNSTPGKNTYKTKIYLEEMTKESLIT